MGDRRKLIGIIGAVVLALVGTVLVLGARGGDDTAAPTRQPISVLVAGRPLAAGSSAEKLAGQSDAVVVRQVAPEEVSPGAFSAVADLAALGDRVVARDIAAGAQLTEASFADRTMLQISAGGVQVPTDRLQVSFSLEPQRVLGGKLRPGDLVAVVFSETEARQTHIIVQKALVANVQLANLANVNEAAAGAPAEGEANPAVTGNYTITLGLTAPDVERVTHALEFGRVWLAKQPETADGSGTQIWTTPLILSEPVTAYQPQPAQ